jgi:hypothetical protein
MQQGRCFKAVDPVSEGKAKFIAIDEQPNHQVVHLFRLGKAQRAADEPLNPGPQINLRCGKVILASEFG